MTEDDDKRTEEEKDRQEEGAEMSFWAHLEILRRAIFRVLFVYAILFVAALWAMPHVFSGFVLGPTTSDFFVYRWLTEWSCGAIDLSQDFYAQIININVASQLMTHFNASLALALIAAFPYVIYELWLYVRPALFPRELRHVRIAFVGGTAMFYVGCLVGYTLIFPIVFRFLAEYQLSSDIVNQINLQSYVNTFTTLILIMGIVFEMPLVAWLLSGLGILHKGFLRQYRRHAVVVLLVLAAFITPTGDPFTLALVFVPLYLLYELSILVVRR